MSSSRLVVFEPKKAANDKDIKWLNTHQSEALCCRTWTKHVSTENGFPFNAPLTHSKNGYGWVYFSQSQFLHWVGFGNHNLIPTSWLTIKANWAETLAEALISSSADFFYCSPKTIGEDFWDKTIKAIAVSYINKISPISLGWTCNRFYTGCCFKALISVNYEHLLPMTFKIKIYIWAVKNICE